MNDDSTESNGEINSSGSEDGENKKNTGPTSESSNGGINSSGSENGEDKKKTNSPGSGDKDDLIKEFRKIYFYRNKGKGEEDEKEKEAAGGEDYVEKRTVLMEMAKAYREMFNVENTLVHNRTNCFLVLNGFLIAAVAAALTRYKEIKEAGAECVLILAALCIAIVGITAVLKYRREINKGRRANLFLQARWKKFIKTFYKYRLKNDNPDKTWIFLSRECILPPVLGLSAREEAHAKQKMDECKECKVGEECEECKIRESDYKPAIWVDDGKNKGRHYEYASTDTWFDKFMDKLALWERWIQLDYVLLGLWIAFFLTMSGWGLSALKPSAEDSGMNGVKQHQVEISVPNSLNLHINANSEVHQYPKSEQEMRPIGTD